MSVLTQIDQWPVDNAVCVIIGTGGQILDSYGDTEHSYALASVTKLLSAYAFLIALEEEAITLDDPVGPRGSTVRHLLAHTSGYDFDSEKIRFQPGAKRGYSNVGFDILSHHLESETGITLQNYAREAIFQPLGMTNTTIGGSGAKDGWSTASDLSQFAAELIAPKLLSRGTLDSATNVQFDRVSGLLPGYGNQSPNDWGLGFEIRGRKNPHWTGSSQPTNTVGHFGQSGTYLWLEPELPLACVTLTDKNFGSWSTKLWSPFNDAVHEYYAVENNPFAGAESIQNGPTDQNV
ncbi:serine hydrolase domain-containing protein [Glutamicibacter ardleyensis]|uniref:serine hydrolase domain-containing protein n=1 Tax=Glutamicibacter ardleyensis TaxID=225894 RepID=UPI003F91BE92